MADPLAALAEREVPERTNYFDPADAQDIISRYSNNRRQNQELGASAERISRVQSMDRNARDEEARMARQQLERDRVDEEYFGRKDALAQQGEFMERLYEIRGDDPEYDTKITTFLGSAPAELLEEPNVKAALAHKGKVNADFRQRMDAEALRNQSRDTQIAVIRERAKNTAALKGITEEDIAEATMPDGSIDMLALGMKAGQRERELKAGEFDRKVDKTTESRIKLMDEAKARKVVPLDDSVFADSEAFPSRVADVKAEYKRVTGRQPLDSVLESQEEWSEKYAAAKAQDAKRKDFELDTAFNYDDPEEYVNFREGLSEKAKARRRGVWEARHGITVGEAKNSSAPSAPAGKKPLTREAAAQFKDQAKGDRAEAERLAREAGFDF